LVAVDPFCRFVKIPGDFERAVRVIMCGQQLVLGKIQDIGQRVAAQGSHLGGGLSRQSAGTVMRCCFPARLLAP
jgi:hypothetical protein